MLLINGARPGEGMKKSIHEREGRETSEWLAVVFESEQETAHTQCGDQTPGYLGAPYSQWQENSCSGRVRSSGVCVHQVVTSQCNWLSYVSDIWIPLWSKFARDSILHAVELWMWFFTEYAWNYIDCMKLVFPHAIQCTGIVFMFDLAALMLVPVFTIQTWTVDAERQVTKGWLKKG